MTIKNREAEKSGKIFASNVLFETESENLRYEYLRKSERNTFVIKPIIKFCESFFIESYIFFLSILSSCER